MSYRHPATKFQMVSALLLAMAFSSAAFAAPPSQRGHHPVGLGKVLTTKDGGQIFGFDIDQSGDDGVLASSQDVGLQDTLVSVETFDQNTGKIIKSFAKYQGTKNFYAVDGIFAGDVALITHDITPDGSLYARRKYEVMNPVTANKFTGPWTPPIKDLEVEMAGSDQTTTASLLYAIELKHQDVPDLLVSDVAANTFSKIIHLDSRFSFFTIPQMAQFTAANEAVIATSPDGGRRDGDPPINGLIDLSTGNVTVFNGYNNGIYGAGLVNGIAVDPNTGVAATTTELNAQVEFYDLNKKTGISFAQLPCTGDADQFYSGDRIAADPVNKLFLVLEPYNACSGGADSALIVYDEAGNLVESITGFTVPKQVVIDPPPRINPGKRMGWVFGGPGGSVNQLQQFFY